MTWVVWLYVAVSGILAFEAFRIQSFSVCQFFYRQCIVL